MTALSEHPGSTADRFVETVDRGNATVSGHGHLSEQGADLIRGAVEMLHRSGHSLITVDLRAVGAIDDEALATVHALAAQLHAHHGEVVVLSKEGTKGT